MSRKGFISLGLLLLALVVAVVVILVALTSGKSATEAAQTFEKGAQLTALPAPVTPLPTGPTEPTPLPTSTALPVQPTLASTPTPLATPVAAPLTVTTDPNTATAAPASQTPTPRPANYVIPNKIKIPSIQVDTFVERVGVTKEGNMDVPKNIWNTAWFGNGGYRPGDPGNAVIAGHLDAPGTVAVFWNLDKIKVGDKVILTDQSGKTMTFEVYDKQVYPINNAPLQTIFGPSNEAHLNLITCGGTFDRSAHIYNKRLVVYTRLAATA